MRFHIDIDRVTDGRPEGRVRTDPDAAGDAFAGWVDLLRLLEQRCECLDGPTTHPTTTNQGSSVRCS